MASCQLNKLFALTDEKWIWYYDESADRNILLPRPTSITLGRNPLKPTLHARVVTVSDVEPYPRRRVELRVE
jgi:hypothetical protein